MAKVLDHALEDVAVSRFLQDLVDEYAWDDDPEPVIVLMED